MENQEVFKKRGRPFLYNNDKDGQEARTRSKNKYGLETKWFCDICNNNHNYTMAGKHSHLNTQKHRRNEFIKDFYHLQEE